MLGFLAGLAVGVICSTVLFYIGLVFHKSELTTVSPGAIIQRLKPHAAGGKRSPKINDDAAALRVERDREKGNRNGT